LRGSSIGIAGIEATKPKEEKSRRRFQFTIASEKENRNNRYFSRVFCKEKKKNQNDITSITNLGEKKMSKNKAHNTKPFVVKSTQTLFFLGNKLGTT